MHDSTKVVLFVISLPLNYFVHNRWETEKQEWEKEICQADQDCAREVRQAEQEREREKEIKNFASQTRNRQENFARQSRNGSEKLSTKSGFRIIDIGMQQALWIGAERSLACSKQRKFGSWLIQVKTFRIATRTHHIYFEQNWRPEFRCIYILAPWYLYDMFTIICWVILIPLVGYF